MLQRPQRAVKRGGQGSEHSGRRERCWVTGQLLFRWPIHELGICSVKQAEQYLDITI